MPEKPKPSPDTPIDDDGIRRAIAMTGYPFEMRILSFFHENEMDPIFGHRLAVRPGEPTKEIDLIANMALPVDPGGGPIIAAQIRIPTAAKSLDPTKAFVGFTWDPPSVHERRHYRCKVGGVPSWGVSPGDVQRLPSMLAAGGIAEAFDELDRDVPVCIQWGVAERRVKNNDEVFSCDHPNAFWDDLDALVRSMRLMMVEHSSWEPPSPVMIWHGPVLVLETSALNLYDVRTKALTKAPRINLLSTYEAHDGIVNAVVDVVTEDGLRDLVARYKSIAMALRDRCQRHSAEIAAAWKAQSETIRKAAFEEEFRKHRERHGQVFR